MGRRRSPLRWLCGGLAGGALLAWFVADLGTRGAAASTVEPLDIGPFEDDDCLEAPGAGQLLQLFDQLCGILDQVLYCPGPERSKAWRLFDAWVKEHRSLAKTLAPLVLARPYCEPGKLAWMAAECLLLLRSGNEGAKDVIACAEAVDEDLLSKMTPINNNYVTRFHMVLRSPWPAFRLLDLLIRLHPENGSTRMGTCEAYRNWQGEPDAFDWPNFKPLVTAAIDLVADDQDILQLRPEDGPLSRQYRARWLRVHGSPGMREAIAFSFDVFDAYRQHHYRAGCHLGVITCYGLQALLVHLRDIEGRLQRYVSSLAVLINLHAPVAESIKSDWPVYRVLHLANLLQRVPPASRWSGLEQGETPAPQDAARVLCRQVKQALLAHAEESGSMAPVAFVTAAWGTLAPFAGLVLQRWASIAAAGTGAPLIFLAVDDSALRECRGVASASVRCVSAPQHLGVEGLVAKYLALATIAHRGVPSVWLDLDIFVASDPTQLMLAALSTPRTDTADEPQLVFAQHMGSYSVSPAVVAVQGTPEAAEIVLRYASWLRENGFLLDHQGWDQFLGNPDGDFAGGFDYKGRTVTIEADRGPPLSFVPSSGVAPAGTRYAFLGPEFGSGDGWQGQPGGKGLVLFHFWGASESQAELFELFFPHSEVGYSDSAVPVLERYRRVLSSAPHLASLLRDSGLGRKPGSGAAGRALHLVSVSYAHGCCQKSIQRNRQQALAVGVDEARAYGWADLSPDWVAKHHAILSQPRGAGWWLWKPYLILRVLRDPAVPWHRGVIIWVDAGNYLHADPRPLVVSALNGSDVSGLRLKWCLEGEWSSAVTLKRLNVSHRYAVLDRPQMGAYFLMFRKTKLAISFVEEWLRRAEDPAALLGTASMSSSTGGPDSAKEIEKLEAKMEGPSFNRHQADQSIFSILFKEYGFRPVTLADGHKVVTLSRWRE